MDHTCPGRNGGFGPVNLPLFHAGRRGLAIGDEGLPSFVVGVPIERPPGVPWWAPSSLIFHDSFWAGFAAWLLARASARQSVTPFQFSACRTRCNAGIAHRLYDARPDILRPSNLRVGLAPAVYASGAVLPPRSRLAG
jgi:hypothetical protein